MTRSEIAKKAREILNDRTAIPVSRLADKAGVNYSNLRRALSEGYAETTGALVDLGYLRKLAKALREEGVRAREAARLLDELDAKARR